ncbi:MAG: TlyA family RNA methyltransferase [Candidatus Eremiobacteraeota bacterium]|nr:TlyA family RNA methyltransferase [Candidatus Eremiobacteraeota bacterium]
MRLDAAVAAREGITRSQARGLILAGRVRIGGAPATKPGTAVRDAGAVEIVQSQRFVSRGGEKLEAALEAFEIDVSGAHVLDVGASTGGFTDCLLQRGAAAVTAVDVGYGQLAWSLRNDPRVTVMERTNFRHLTDDAFEKPFDFVTIDTSFISLRTIVRRAVAFVAPEGAIVALVKPQFEAGRERVGGGGVVRDPEVHRAVLREVRNAMEPLGMPMVALMASPLLGPAGNREFLALLRRAGTPVADHTIDAVVAEPVA